MADEPVNLAITGLDATTGFYDIDTVTVSSVAGPFSTKHVDFAINSGVGNKYAYVEKDLSTSSIGAGTVYATEFDLFLPTGFHAACQGNMSIVGHDPYPQTNLDSRIVMDAASDTWKMVYRISTSGSSEGDLTNTFTIPENTMVRMRLEQKLSFGADGYTKVWKDGVLVGSGTGANLYSGSSTPGVTRIQWGIDSINSAVQTNALNLKMDNLTFEVLSGVALSPLYPGDSYVHWTAISGYNWASGEWTSFADIFEDSYNSIIAFAPNKPMVIGPVGSTESGGSKATWIADMFTTLDTFSLAEALVWNNWLGSRNGGTQDWYIESTTSARNAFRTGIADTKFKAALSGAPSGEVPRSGEDDWSVTPLSVFPIAGSTSTWLRVSVFGETNSIAVQWRVNGVTSTTGALPYDSATMIYFSMVEHLGDLTFKYSADGVTWVDWVEMASPFSFASCEIRITAGAANSVTDRTARLDNFNILPEEPDDPDVELFDLMLALTPQNTTGWEFQTSNAANSVTNLGDRIRSTVGGFAAGTHYARVRRLIPEEDDFEVWGRFVVSATFELPTNFHSQNEGYVRFVTMDNFPATHGSSTIGAKDDNEWRIGFQTYADGIPRLISNHDGGQEVILWTGDAPIPVGLNTIHLDFTPSQTTEGAVILRYNGVEVLNETDIQTVPNTLEDYEVVVTRVGIGLDDALFQDTKQLTFYTQSLNFGANEQEGVDPPGPSTSTPISLVDNFDDNSIDAAKWTSDGGVTETAGQIKFTAAGGATASPFLSSFARHSLVDKYVTIKLIDPNVSGGVAAVYADFNQADGAFPNTFSGTTGLLAVSGNRGIRSGGGLTLVGHNTQLSSVDMEASISFYTVGNPGWYHALLVRMNDPAATSAAGSWYEFSFNESGTDAGIYRTVNGVATPLAQGSIASSIQFNFIAPALRVQTVGGNPVLNAWVHNTPVFSNVTDTSGSKLLTGGYVGLANFGDAAFDDLVGSEYPAGSGAGLDNWSTDLLAAYPVVGSTDTYVKIVYLAANNTIVARRRVGGVTTDFGAITYNPATMVYFRMMENNGLLTFEHSVLGGTWTTWTQMTTPFDVSSCQVRIGASVTSAIGSHSAILDDFNILPGSPEPDPDPDPDPEPDPDPDPDPGTWPLPTALSQVGPRIPLVNDSRSVLSPGTYSGRRFTQRVSLSGAGNYYFNDCDIPLATLEYQAGRYVVLTHCSCSWGQFFANGGQAGLTADWCYFIQNDVALRPEGRPQNNTSFSTPMTIRSTYLGSQGTPSSPTTHCEAFQSLGGRTFTFIGVWFYAQPRLNPQGSTYNTAAQSGSMEDATFTRCGFGEAGVSGSFVWTIYTGGGVNNRYNDCVVGVIGGTTRALAAGDFWTGTPAGEKAILNGTRIT
jgi:hypothetical protein